jgi:hypothetical protein
MNEETAAADIAGVDLPLGDKNNKYNQIVKRIKKIKKRKPDAKQIQQAPE